MYNYYNADGLLFRMQVLAPNTDSGSERVTKSGVSDLDKYVFFGCHTSGHHYQYYLDHHTDVCLSKQLSHSKTKSVFITRSQSVPDMRRPFYAGQDCIPPPVWSHLEFCLVKKSYSHYTFSDPDFKVNYVLPVFDPCAICHEEHPFQHTMDEWDLYYQSRRVSVPDSISTDTVADSYEWTNDKSEKMSNE